MPKLAFLSRAHSGIRAGSGPGCVKARVEELLQRISQWVATSLSYPPKNSPWSPCPRTATPRCAFENCSACVREKVGAQDISRVPAACQEQDCSWAWPLGGKSRDTGHSCVLSSKSGCCKSSAPRIPSLTVHLLSIHCMPDTQHAVWNQV